MSSLLTYPGGTTCTKDFVHLIGRMMSIVPNVMLVCMQYPFHILYRSIARWSDPEVGVTIINYYTGPEVGVAITNYYVTANIYSHDDDRSIVRASASALCTNLVVATVWTFCTWSGPARCTVEHTLRTDRILPHQYKF